MALLVPFYRRQSGPKHQTKLETLWGFFITPMKTNKIMIRQLDNFEVHQRTKDKMFNATSLAKQWNSISGNPRKDAGDFLRLSSTKEFIEALISENSDTGNPVSVTKGGKGAQGTWMHPYLFIDFAMWLNPTFKVRVLKFVHDQLIANRHNAGDNYRLLAASISKLPGSDYKQLAEAMNWIVFNKKGKELRQSATQDQLKELADIESKLSYAIDMGFIGSYRALLHTMRSMWSKKHESKPF